MRVTVRPEHPAAKGAKHRWVGTYRIFLDGEEITDRVHTADSDEGWAVVYLLNEQGQKYLDETGEGAAEEVQYGNVEIRPREPLRRVSGRKEDRVAGVAEILPGPHSRIEVETLARRWLAQHNASVHGEAEPPAPPDWIIERLLATCDNLARLAVKNLYRVPPQ